MSSVYIEEESERTNEEVYTRTVHDSVDRSSSAPERIDIGTEAPHTVCIDQLCEAVDICHQEPYQIIPEDYALSPEDEGFINNVDPSKKICTCVIDPLLDYAAQENLRKQLKNEMLQAMIQAEFIDEFMIFFMEDLLEAIFSAFTEESLESLKNLDDSDAERVKVPEITDDNIYFWMSYFYMQYCGYQLFLSTLASHAGASITAKTEMAAIITDIVDEVARSSEYLQHDSDVPEKICKNIIWGMLNTRRFYRRYINMSEAQILAGDIIDDIIQQIGTVKKDVVEFSITRPASTMKTSISHDYFLQRETCKDFMDIDKVANLFISKLIAKSKETAQEIFKKDDRYVPNISLETILQFSEISFEFPSIEEFSIDVGIEAIQNYMATWDYSECWIYDVKYLMGQSDACSDFYFFEAIWSIPTALYPVPQATASIIFRIEVSRVKPPVCCVDVTYKFEGRGLVHTPFKYDFTEEWLFDIMYSKLRLYASLRF